MTNDDLDFVRRVGLVYGGTYVLRLLSERAALVAALQATTELLTRVVGELKRTPRLPPAAVERARCDATTSTLRSCRNPVAHGRRCRWHELPLRPVPLPALSCSLSPR
jgi:hypothetical protein